MPPVPLTIFQTPVPTVGVLPARVVLVRPHILAPTWSVPAAATVPGLGRAPPPTASSAAPAATRRSMMSAVRERSAPARPMRSRRRPCLSTVPSARKRISLQLRPSPLPPAVGSCERQLSRPLRRGSRKCTRNVVAAALSTPHCPMRHTVLLARSREPRLRQCPLSSATRSMWKTSPRRSAS